MSVISLVALLISVVFGIRQIGLQGRVTKIEEERRREEIQLRRRADLTTYIQSEKNSRGATVWILVIENVGSAPAREIKFDIAAKDGEAPILVYEPELPVPLIDPGQRYRIALQIMLNTAPFVQVSLLWTDDEGGKSKELSLSVF